MSKIDKMDRLFEATFATIADSGKPLVRDRGGVVSERGVGERDKGG